MHSEFDVPTCKADDANPQNEAQKIKPSPLSRPDRLGEPPIRTQVAARQDPWLVLLGKELPDQFSPAAHADFLEDRLEVVLHRIGRDVEGVGDLCR